jgi:hypothetical protein
VWLSRQLLPVAKQTRIPESTAFRTAALVRGVTFPAGQSRVPSISTATSRIGRAEGKASAAEGKA